MHFFTPGRTEIIGNHTDHQLGRVIASAVAQGIYADAETTEDGVIALRSEGYGEVRVDLSDLSPRAKEAGTAAALVRGMACAVTELGCRIGGFRADVRSELPVGGGLSSSAAFTVLIGKIVNTLYNDDRIPPQEIAKCAQRAENRHFLKPSGLMDQMACAMERAVYIDFLTGEVQPLDCDFAAMGLSLCLTDTGGSHAGLTDAYAEIPADMCAAAGEYGKEKLGYVNYFDFLNANPPHDRIHDRARHFFEENERVPRMRAAILAGDAAECIALMNASGRSSELLLRNIKAPGGDDRLGKGLALSAKLLEGKGAWRVHGGGFAGCVQALVPLNELEFYRAAMDAAFGKGSCINIM